MSTLTYITIRGNCCDIITDISSVILFIYFVCFVFQGSLIKKTLSWSFFQTWTIGNGWKTSSSDAYNELVPRCCEHPENACVFTRVTRETFSVSASAHSKRCGSVGGACCKWVMKGMALQALALTVHLLLLSSENILHRTTLNAFTLVVATILVATVIFIVPNLCHLCRLACTQNQHFHLVRCYKRFCCW